MIFNCEKDGHFNHWCSLNIQLSIIIYSSISLTLSLVSFRFQIPCFYLPWRNLVTDRITLHFLIPAGSPTASNASEPRGMTDTCHSSGNFMHNGCQTALMRWVEWQFPNFLCTLPPSYIFQHCAVGKHTMQNQSSNTRTTHNTLTRSQHSYQDLLWN